MEKSPPMVLPSIEEARALLSAAEKLNPGAWVSHSQFVAGAAAAIAAVAAGMDADVAYTLGLLHDIGRREGVMDMYHILTGYRHLVELGYPAAARICLTHCFPLQEIGSVGSNWDGTVEELAFVATYIESVIYDDYDRLIQLCDALALPGGFCLLEQRFVDVALRRGINELTLDRWRITFEIMQAFDARCGTSIYKLLPGFNRC
ncbi:MAG TPA: HD domain-containing protein [Levilinea sp.]|nr:HD domain-containing protein [Levilinea sp.]